MAYSYDNAGRRTGMNLSNGNTSFAQANYTYDTMGRVATVGNSADTMTYTYVPGTNMIGSAAWQNASINTVNTYDQYKRLTNIAVNNTNVYSYALNDKNQRMGATLPDGNTWAYTYDVMGQLTGAVKQDTANNPLASMSYLYDLIGNRTSATENNAVTTYTSNLVNQYTLVNAVVPVYDLDGNMTSYNGWSFTWNGENRLIVAENTAAGIRVEADYDYMGRRIFKKVYNNNTLTKHSIFVYDGFKQIAEFDALNGNALIANYLWQPVGLDVPLLRNGEYLIADGNKNIIQLRDATGNVTDNYGYDPFGSVTHTGSSSNPFRFSSEFHDDETGLVYYNYRYYSPTLGRWTKRDPIEEEGGINLYTIVNNEINISHDVLGFSRFAGCCGKDVTKQLNKLIKKVYEEVQSLKESKIGIISNIYNGWDIEELHTDGSSKLPTSNYPPQHLCYATATYQGKCYRTQDLNYMLYATLLEAEKNFFTDGISKLTGELAITAYVFYQGITVSSLNINKKKIYNATSVQIKQLHSNKIDIIDLSKYNIRHLDCCRPSEKIYDGELRARFTSSPSIKPQEISVK